MDEATPAVEMTVDTAADKIGELRQAAAEPSTTDSKPEGAPEATQADKTPDAQNDAHDATPEDNDDTVEPTIAAPSGWNAEDKEWFATLEPARQEVILRRERQLQADQSRARNEHNAALKEAQAAREAAANERQYFKSVADKYRPQLVAAYENEFADLVRGETDLFRLAQQPDRWARYQAYQQSYAQLAQTEQAMAKQAQAEEAEKWENHVQTRNRELIEAKPELKDPAKFQAYDNEVSSYLLEQDVPADAIRRISFKELRIVDKAMNWDKAQKAKANPPAKPQALAPGQVKVSEHVRQVSRVMKPGTPRDDGAGEDQFAARRETLRKTGSMDDAAAAIGALFNRKRA